MLRKRSLLVGIAGVALLVGGCGSGGSDAPTVSVTAPAPTTASDGTTASDSASSVDGSGSATSPADTTAGLGDASGNGLCLDPSSPAVASILDGVDTGIGDVGWAVREASAEPADACPDLSYLVVDVAGATASSPTQILFFHHGNYLGTGTAQATSFTNIVGATPDAVTAEYRWIVGDEASCCPEGGPSTVTFGWNGSGVTAEGQFPPYL